MMRRMYQVDAFADRLFHGNPPAFCPLPERLTADHRQDIAAENKPVGDWFLRSQRQPVQDPPVHAAGGVGPARTRNPGLGLRSPNPGEGNRGKRRAVVDIILRLSAPELEREPEDLE